MGACHQRQMPCSVLPGWHKNHFTSLSHLHPSRWGLSLQHAHNTHKTILQHIFKVTPKKGAKLLKLEIFKFPLSIPKKKKQNKTNKQTNKQKKKNKKEIAEEQEVHYERLMQ